MINLVHLNLEKSFLKLYNQDPIKTKWGTGLDFICSPIFYNVRTNKHFSCLRIHIATTNAYVDKQGTVA